jgi:hypothetical protein
MAVTAYSTQVSLLESLKISLFTKGLRITAGAELALTRGGEIPLSVHEYATTGGVTLVVGDGIYINAPFDNAFCDPEATLDGVPGSHDEFVVTFRGEELTASVLPLPGFLATLDSHGRPVTATTFSHADRVRVSPIWGCSFRCDFCDLAGGPYVKRPAEQLLEGIEVARHDHNLPASHLLISGGTPSSRDYGYFDETAAAVIAGARMPVDVMMPPRPTDPGFFGRLADFGAFGFSINLELYGDEATRRIAPQKHRIGRRGYADTIERAVARVGAGRVRSLLLVGLDSEEDTLQAIEFLANLGCDPVLSPFRPTAGTPLADAPAPSYELVERVYLEAQAIVERHGVKLGPRCIPCQHNTLTFPDASGAYFYSADLPRA